MKLMIYASCSQAGDHGGITSFVSHSAYSTSKKLKTNKKTFFNLCVLTQIQQIRVLDSSHQPHDHWTMYLQQSPKRRISAALPVWQASNQTQSQVLTVYWISWKTGRHQRRIHKADTVIGDELFLSVSPPPPKVPLFPGFQCYFKSCC